MAKKIKGRTVTGVRKDLSKIAGCSCKSFVIRESNGIDEEMAAQAAKFKGGSITPQEEIVRLCIVKVDDEDVEQPFLAFDTWNSKTRGLAMTAYQALNLATKKEMEDFLAQGEVVEIAASLESSSQEEESIDDLDESGSE